MVQWRQFDITPMNEPTILIADDDPRDIFLLKRQLVRARICNEVRVVTDGADVYAYLQHEGFFMEREEYPYPVLIFLDINMPTSGFNVLSFLRSHPLHRNIPVVALSGSDDPACVTAAYKLGARSFLMKPAESDALLNMVRGLDGVELTHTQNGLLIERVSSLVPELTAA